MWFNADRSSSNRRHRWPLSLPLLSLSDKDAFTLADACEGVQVRATGSGKTTGSGFRLAMAFLLAGMGAFILTAKPDNARCGNATARRRAAFKT